MIAKKDSTVRVFRLKKTLVDKHQHKELNEVMRLAEEISLSKMPGHVRKEISQK